MIVNLFPQKLTMLRLCKNVQHVQSYIEEELEFNAILGPFDNKPIPLHVSPLMVRDKQDSLKKELSWT